MEEQAVVWSSLISGPGSEKALRAAMECVARGLSALVGQPISSSTPRVRRMPIAQVVTRAGFSGAKTVGVYLQIKSGLRGRAILLLPLSLALNLADLVMESPRGTATRLGDLERSALAEVGNLTLSYFLNAVAELTDRQEVLHPSPPGVIVGMLGAILNLMVAPAAAVSDDLLILEAVFRDAARTVQIRFWVSPDPRVLCGSEIK